MCGNSEVLEKCKNTKTVQKTNKNARESLYKYTIHAR